MAIFVTITVSFDLICVQCGVKMQTKDPQSGKHECPQCGFKVEARPFTPTPSAPGVPGFSIKPGATFKRPRPAA